LYQQPVAAAAETVPVLLAARVAALVTVRLLAGRVRRGRVPRAAPVSTVAMRRPVSAAAAVVVRERSAARLARTRTPARRELEALERRAQLRVRRSRTPVVVVVRGNATLLPIRKAPAVPVVVVRAAEKQ
jgi:hypothetical protein